MRKPLLLAVALLATNVSTASGQGGFNLFWEHCSADDGAITSLFDCSANVGSATLIVSVILPANLPQFAAAAVTLDVRVADGSIPPWWQVAAGQCRANAVAVSFDPTGFPESDNCPAIWGSTVPQQVFAIQPGLGGPDMFRVSAVAAVPAGSELSLLADGSELVVCRLIVRRTKSVGADACEGCRTGACFWLSEMTLYQPADLGNYRVWGPAENMLVGHNAKGTIYVYVAHDIDCTTPTLNRTWGAIKGMFR